MKKYLPSKTRVYPLTHEKYNEYVNLSLIQKLNPDNSIRYIQLLDLECCPLKEDTILDDTYSTSEDSYARIPVARDRDFLFYLVTHSVYRGFLFDPMDVELLHVEK